MSIQEMIDRGDVSHDELHEYLTMLHSIDDAQTNHADDTVIDEYDGINRMIKAESESLERFLLIRIDDLERRLGNVMTLLEGMQTF